MERRLIQGTGVVVLLIAVSMVLNAIFSPGDRVRAELARELAQVPDQAPLSGADAQDLAALTLPIRTKPNLWQEIVAAPPAPPAPKATPAPAPRTAPDLGAMLQGLVMQPGQIGKDKMRVITPSRPDGDWMAIGDTFNGCTLESFTREEAVFRLDWKTGGEVLRKTLPRPLR